MTSRAVANGSAPKAGSGWIAAALMPPIPEWKKGKSLPEELRKVKLYESPGHQRNFLDCVKSRQPTITPVETAHHSAIPGHLGLISMLVGRKIYWDVATETIIGDPEASKLLTREYRAPWQFV